MAAKTPKISPIKPFLSLGNAVRPAFACFLLHRGSRMNDRIYVYGTIKKGSLQFSLTECAITQQMHPRVIQPPNFWLLEKTKRLLKLHAAIT